MQQLFTLISHDLQEDFAFDYLLFRIANSRCLLLVCIRVSERKLLARLNLRIIKLNSASTGTFDFFSFPCFSFVFFFCSNSQTYFPKKNELSTKGLSIELVTLLGRGFNHFNINYRQFLCPYYHAHFIVLFALSNFQFLFKNYKRFQKYVCYIFYFYFITR